MTFYDHRLGKPLVTLSPYKTVPNRVTAPVTKALLHETSFISRSSPVATGPLPPPTPACGRLCRGRRC